MTDSWYRWLFFASRPIRRKSTLPVKVHKASDYLKTPEDIAAYLNAAIEEFDGDTRLLMKAFRNVAAAQGGVSELARRADVNRVGLSRGLSGNRDPRLGTVTKIAAACGGETSICGVKTAMTGGDCKERTGYL